MRLLLDTHIAIWALVEDKRLGDRARSLIESPDNDIVVSTASVWEIAIKRNVVKTGRGAIQISAADAVDRFTRAGFSLLAISAAHAAAVEHLPPVHGDPFDRLLVAQALNEPMKLVTRDAVLAGYGEMVILV